MKDPSVTPQIRTSERVLFKRCKQAWWWAYREGLKPKRVKTALQFGEWYHVALALWYCGPGLKRGPHPAETFDRIAEADMKYVKTKDRTDEEVAEWTDLKLLGTTMLEGYVKSWGRDEQWEVLEPERTFNFDIPWPAWWGEDIRSLLARYVGTYDLVVRDAATGWIWIIEHKTAKAIRVDHLPLDEQGGTYYAAASRSLKAAGLIRPKDVVKGVLYNFSRKAMPDLRPKDPQGYATNKPLKADYVRALEAHWMSAYWRPGELEAEVARVSRLKLDQLEALAAQLPTPVLGERSKVQPSALYLREPAPRTRAEQRSQLQRIQDDAATMEVYRRGELPITKTTHWSCARLCDFYEICRLHETSGNWQDLRNVAYRVEDPYAAHRKSTDEIGSFEL